MVSAPAPPRVQINIPELHPAQRDIVKSAARFKVVNCGRRFGKTLLGIVVAVFGNESASVKGAMQGERIWWVAPHYKEAMEGWDYLMRLVHQMPTSMTEIHVSELRVSFRSGGSVQVRTADDPNSLRGAGLGGVVLDEYATMKADAWTVIRPALADKQGWALFISTPQHFNHFYDLYTHAEANEDGEWAAWTHPTWDNPFIPESEIEAAKRDMLPEDFDQEFGASFTAIGGAVFRILAANRHLFLRPMPQDVTFRRVGIGMDWGTTPQHEASVVCGGQTPSGSVWIRSAWLDHSASDDLWFAEAQRCKTDYGATFARYDRSQGSAHDRLMRMGYEADKGVADVEARVGAYMGFMHPVKNIFFDSSGPGVVGYFNHLCEYHRYPATDPKAGQIVEERDDDVDAGGYLVIEFAQPRGNMPNAIAVKQPSRRLGAGKASGWSFKG